MARKPRLFKSDMTFIVQQSSLNNDPCFYDEYDHQFFLILIHNGLERYRIKLHAFVLLDTSFKLLLSPTTDNGIPQLTQLISSKYSKYFNQKYQRKGSIWSGRYKASPVESPSYILPCMRYLESLPVIEGVVDLPERYQWSSYIDNTTDARFSERIKIPKNHRKKLTKLYANRIEDTQQNVNLNQVQEPKKSFLSQYLLIENMSLKQLITEHPKFETLGGNLINRKLFYKELFFMEHNAVDKPFFDERLQHQYPIGSDEFVKSVEAMFSVKFHQIKPGRPRKSVNE